MIPIRDINPTRTKPLITVVLIVINIAVYFLLQPTGDPEAEALFLYENAVIACEVTEGSPITIEEIRSFRCGSDAGTEPFPAKNVYLAAFVSMFLHGGVFHVFSNMWFLWIFGNNIEEAFGPVAYLALYVAAGLVATIGFVLFNSGSTVPLVGASGAVAGVLGAYALLFPRHRVLSLVFVVFVPIPAMVFLAFWFFSQFAIPSEAVAWEAHVVGFIFGLGVALVFRDRLRDRLTRIHAPPDIPF